MCPLCFNWVMQASRRTTSNYVGSDPDSTLIVEFQLMLVVTLSALFTFYPLSDLQTAARSLIAARRVAAASRRAIAAARQMVAAAGRVAAATRRLITAARRVILLLGEWLLLLDE